MRRLTGVEMIKKLKKLGFKVYKIKSSHYHMTNGDGYAVVPHHHQELGKGLYEQILKDAKLK